MFVRDLERGRTELVSVSSRGEQGNGVSGLGGLAISPDGRYVAFTSTAPNLVPHNTSGVTDVFVRDRERGRTERVSVSSGGRQADGASFEPSISANGRYVAFVSDATDLVPGDTNSTPACPLCGRDVFVHDRKTGRTERVSVSSRGRQGNDVSEAGDQAISADGRLVVFDSDASNLVPGDTNRERDVFVHDRKTGRTELVSVSASGGQRNRFSSDPAISADGRYVAFNSDVTDLVPGETSSSPELFILDVFVRDLERGRTERVSVGPHGRRGNGDSAIGTDAGAISPDGRYVVFESDATNLVPDDTNHVSDVLVRTR